MSVIKKLESVGINVTPYKRGPLGKNPFSLSVDNDKIRIWEGGADIVVRTNRRKKQCLLTVTEKSRTVKEKTRIVRTANEKAEGNKFKPGRTFSTYEEAAKYSETPYKPTRSNCRIFVPNSRFSQKFLSAQTARDSIYRHRTIVFNFELKQNAGKTTSTFLVGFDESASAKPFICLLKDNVDTFEDAYKSLLPVDVKLHPKHKRQGEWFLNPVHDKLEYELLKYSALNHKELCTMRLNGAMRNGSWSGWSKVNISSHEGTCVNYEGKLYAIGEVKDVRKGRHEPVYLDSFHEVIRNNEAVEPERNVRNWD
jgi:hypothetical protein